MSLSAVIWLAWAGASEVEHPKSTFRAGRIQGRVGLGIEFNGIGGGNILSIAEGWHPASAAVDVGLVNLGPVTIGIGAEGVAATQVLVNPFLRVRERLGEHLPEFLGFAPDEEANWRWRIGTLGLGGRLHVHLNTLDGRPYLVVVGERHAYAARLTHRTDDRSDTFRSTIWGVSAGAGATRVMKGGFVANVEVRYGFPLINDAGSHPPKSIDIQGTTVPILRRMRPPPGVVFIGAVGFRL